MSVDLKNGNVAGLGRLYMQMLHVEFKKWQCPICHLVLSPVACPHAQCHLSILRKICVTLSNIRVEGHCSIYRYVIIEIHTVMVKIHSVIIEIQSNILQIQAVILSIDAIRFGRFDSLCRVV